MMFPLKQNNNLQQSENNVWVLDLAESFAYSEGDEAEEYIRACLDSVDDLCVDSVQLQERIKDWSSEYHLSPARANLVRSIRLEGMENILELGSGCGAITRYLGEQGCCVEAVEGSLVRAEFTRKRCRDLENVHVVNANFNSLTLPKNQYDAIFLIGVLEYAAMFLPGEKNSRESVISLLKIVHKALKPDGILVIAIENRMGLKYWIGAGEDHSGQRDIGLYGYPVDDGIRTFDKREWKDIVADAGVGFYTFVYPFPDYKLPRVLISDDFVARDPYAYSLLNRIPSSDPLTGWKANDDEFLRWKSLHQSGYLGEFANSFLIILSASDSAVQRTVPFDFVHFSSEGRKVQYRTITEKLKNVNQVVKRSIGPSMERQVQHSCCISQSVHDTRYKTGVLLTTLWLETCCRKDFEPDFAELLQIYVTFVQNNFKETKNKEFLIDLLPSNIVVNDQLRTYDIIDQEWGFSDEFDEHFILFRALLWFGYHNRFLLLRFNQEKSWQTVGDFVEYGFALRALLLQPQLDEYLRLEDRIHAEIAQKSLSFSADAIFQTPLQADSDGNVIRDNSAGIPKQDIKVPDIPSVSTSLKDKIYFLTKRLNKFFKHIKYLTNHHYRALVKSGLFDDRYYVAHDKGIDVRFMNPLIHYIEFGWKEGRNPSLMFDSAYYCQMNPDCEGMDPLLHYAQSGWKAGANPMPFFFTSWYAAKYPESVCRKKNPLSHYLKFGWKSGVNPNPFMDFGGYINNHPELTAEKINPLVHYVIHGFWDSSGPLPFFDADFYQEDNPNLSRMSQSPLAHYVQYGFHDGRAPNRFFDPVYYLEKYNVAGSDQLTAFLHFNAVVCKKNFRPNRLFDPEYYSAIYPEFSATHSHPLQHYQQYGVLEGKYPCREIADLPKKPVISLVTPVYNTDEYLLRRCIHSVLYQAYPHWELCLVDDGSSMPHIREVLDEYERLDDRIRIKILPLNLGISGASNEAAGMATGEYLGFLDHDDELSMDALYEVVLAINNEEPDVIYSDEDLINLENRYTNSFFKPDFNPELLLTHNYITHFLVTRRNMFIKCGGFSGDFNGAQDFDLVLKLTENAAKIHHIPKSLYHWRASETSTSINHTQKVYADAAGKKALETAIVRRNIEAVIEPGEWKFYYRVKRKIVDAPLVTLIVYVTDSRNSSEKWFTRMDKFLSYKALDIQIVSPAENLCPAALYNSAAGESNASHLLFLNQTYIPKNSEWLEALLEYSQIASTGAVTGFVEHAAKLPPLEELSFTSEGSWRQFRRFFIEASRDINNVYCSQNVMGVPIDLFMVKRDLFQECGGFDEVQFPSSLFDMDLSLMFFQKGYMNFYTPYCQMRETGNVIPDDAGGERELSVLRKKWRNVLQNGDPYYNPGRIMKKKNISREKLLRWYTGV